MEITQADRELVVWLTGDDDPAHVRRAAHHRTEATEAANAKLAERDALLRECRRYVVSVRSSANGGVGRSPSGVIARIDAITNAGDA